LSEKVLVTPRSYGKEDPALFEMLAGAGLEIVRNETGGIFTKQQMIEKIAPCAGVIVGVDPLDGVGVDNIDLTECTRRGIVVMNAPDGNTISTAEHTFALLLALARHIPQADASVRAGRWERKKFVGTQLHGKTLGIVGFGRVGRALADRAKAFGMKEVAFDPFVPERIARHLGLACPTLDALLEQADVISLHAVVTDDTRGLINRDTIAKMKDGVIILNNSRGPLVVEQDLADALNSGKVYAAGLDVVSTEPIKADNPLLKAKNCFISPHISWAAKESRSRLMDIAVENLRQFKNGTPVNVVS